MGAVKRIWIKRFKGGPMDRVGSVRMDASAGIKGNADRSRKRQVTVIGAESWRAGAHGEILAGYRKATSPC